jgi:flagellar hook-basal body complex protein FliE
MLKDSKRGNRVVNGIDSHIVMGQLGGLTQPPPKVNEISPGKIFESFGNMLKNNLDKVSQLEEVSDKLMEDYAVGKPVALHTVMIAEGKADLAMNLTMQIRNKGITAYQEIMRMTI